jgi:nucleoside-diphosphate-sugar epimerase
MRTLFLGATGFVGSALLRVLDIDEDLTVLSNKSIPKIEFKARLIQGSITDSETLRKISSNKFERIIDCSWEGLPDLCVTNNLKNLSNKLDLYKKMHHLGIREVNSFGSCLEYGNLTGLVSENAIGQDVGDFGRVKLQILEEIRNLEIPFRWFRPFYLIGVGQHSNSLLNSAINSIRRGLDFSPRTPSASFDFIAIDDAMQGACLAMKDPSCNGVINLGTGNVLPVNDLVNVVRRHFGIEERHSDTSLGLAADIRKISSLTGWKPETPVIEEVLRIITKIGSS